MKSFIYLIVTVFIFFGCTQKSGQDYLKSAEENLKNNKVQEAASDLENFVKENPEDEKSPEALTKLASIYQNKMLKTLSLMLVSFISPLFSLIFSIKAMNTPKPALLMYTRSLKFATI